MTAELGWFDRFKIKSLIRMRRSNRRTVEEWTQGRFRSEKRARVGRAPTVRLAREVYGNPGLPDRLFVPAALPADATLPLGYRLRYYVLAGAAFKALEKLPLATRPAWTPDAWFNGAFPARDHWARATSDEAFARMPLQGANPFLLTQDEYDDGRFVVDYTPYFGSFAPNVRCEYRIAERGLEADIISVDDEIFLPEEPGWAWARTLAMGLDARFAVFGLHLLDTHLIVGQAFALSAYTLPLEHPVRHVLDLFTYGTLGVNDFALRLLISSSSYFIRSHFVTAKDVFQLFEKRLDRFDLDDLVVPRDIKRRGIGAIHGHPYVADAPLAWGAFQDFVRSWAEKPYPDDDAVRGDADLQDWYRHLAHYLPNHDPKERPLDGVDALVTVLCCLLQNQVTHEICGDFSVYGAPDTLDSKRIVNFDHLRDRRHDAPPSAADVFLFEQGAFAGRFNNGGNPMMTLDLQRHVSDPWLRERATAFQGALKTLDGRLGALNDAREKEDGWPFRRLMPSCWEASISF